MILQFKLVIAFIEQSQSFGLWRRNGNFIITAFSGDGGGTSDDNGVGDDADNGDFRNSTWFSKNNNQK